MIGVILIALLQRVSRASVSVSGQRLGAIGRGLMVLVCAERDDNESTADKLAERVWRYRIFEDAAGRMNCSLAELAAAVTAPGARNTSAGCSEAIGANHEVTDAHRQQAGLLLVPQFTLAADTRSGLRPSFTPAAEPALGRHLYERFVSAASLLSDGVQTGSFGANMQVELVNDGPVTIWLQARS